MRKSYGTPTGRGKAKPMGKRPAGAGKPAGAGAGKRASLTNKVRSVRKKATTPPESPVKPTLKYR